MPTPNDGGPAFPTPGYELKQQAGTFGFVEACNLHIGPPAPGMSLRAWLAGSVAPAILADISRASAKSGVQFSYAETAEHSVKYADALLAALQEQPK